MVNLKLKDVVGRKVKIVDINNKIWKGLAIGSDSPEDSEDGQWYLDVRVNNFGILGISESEIKSIEVL